MGEDKTKPIIDEMRTIILWRDMEDFCMSRGKSVDGEKCISCPYYKNLVCNKASTKEILRHAADIFDKFLEEK